MSRAPSASALQRLLVCPGSAVLPAANEISEASDRGTEIHAYLRKRLRGVSKDEALADVPAAYRATCAGINLDDITGDSATLGVEVSYALNAATGEAECLGSNLDRKYPDRDLPWLCGTVDRVAKSLSTVVLIIEDYKTGQPVAECRDNAQLKFYALAASRVVGVTQVEARVRYIREDGSTWVDSHTFDAFDLDAFACELGSIARRIAELAEAYRETHETPPVTAGEHCRYCPALTSCPKKLALARELLPTMQDVAPRILAMTPEERGVAWVKALEVESLLEEVKKGLRDCALVDPTPLPDGRWLMAIESSRTSLMQDKAVELLKEKGATEEEIASLYKTTRFDVVKAVKAAKRKDAA